MMQVWPVVRLFSSVVTEVLPLRAQAAVQQLDSESWIQMQ